MEAYKFEKDLEKSLHTGFIDAKKGSLEAYRPRLLVNNHHEGRKVLSSIVDELRGCEAFFLSVAFITYSGILVLLDELEILKRRGVKGKIIASQYLNFTEPKALEKLLEFDNIDLRMVTQDDLHSKGYIFRKKNQYTMIIGSSNMTQSALTENKEWNVKLSSTDQGSLIQETLDEFQHLFDLGVKVDKKWIDAYKSIYTSASKARWEQRNQEAMLAGEANGPYRENNANNALLIPKVMPNTMQKAALGGIEKVREKGEKRALLISATGTGKTYLSAFDVARVNPKKLLFLAHREQLLDQAIASFKGVLGQHIYAGKVCSDNNDYDAPYVFSTVQTMSKESTLAKVSSDSFDYIIIDESHRIGSESYQRILAYFKPDFLLGMTATPNRTDQYNIFEDFDYNIAYEIHLQQAMEEKMLCPFHYFGITDLKVDGQEVSDDTDFSHLISEERVNHMIDRMTFYGHDGDHVKGLVFCSRNEEASELSRIFNQRGYRTLALSGSDSMDKRQEAIDRLEDEEDLNHLDYIFTVDIFNEGVDIPLVNQIVMLRPTQSAIVFVQQLGRGLRQAAHKEFVVVLDFIGNYKNNFMIPMALSEDRSYNKDTIRRFTVEGSKVIPGCSTIHFDEIARKKIFEAIDRVNFKSVKYMKENYKTLKFRLGRIPSLMDFEEEGAMDISVMFNSKIGSYHQFLKKYEPDYEIVLNEIQEEMVTFISKKCAIGKRPHELLVLSAILQGKEHPLDIMEEQLSNDYGLLVKGKTRVNVTNVLTNQFATGTMKNTFTRSIFLENEDVSPEFLEALEDPKFKVMVQELVDLGLYRNQRYYGDSYKKIPLVLYQKYSYEDICRLLEWEKGEVALNIGGYKYDKASATYPIFINYDKAEDIESSIKYEDRFESPSKIIALSKAGRDQNSADVQVALKSTELGVDMELFVRKNKDDKESKEFYYLGRIYPTGDYENIVMEESGKKAVEIHYRLETAVRDELYDYILS